jgi:adenylate kinase family enzyme
MAVKLFVLGLPGSGKSTVSRAIAEYVGKKGLETTRINDYVILEQMFHDDIEGKQFRSAGQGGFDVLDLSAFDTALKRLEQATEQYILTTKPEGIILIEFARNDYQKAFQQFNQDFLQNAYFLYLAVDIGTCKKRIHERIVHPTTPDDHFVSEYIFSAYYNKDNGQDIPHMLEEDYGVGMQRVMVIDNKGLLEEAAPKIHLFSDFVIAHWLNCVGTFSVSKPLASIV